MSGLLDFLQAASNSAASNVSGPVDLIGMALRKMGVPVPEDALGSSQWMERQGLTRPVKQGAVNVAGETAGLLSPVLLAAKAPQVARGLLQMGENAAAPRSIVGPSAGERGMILYHGTNDSRPLTRVKPNEGVFDGLFASQSKGKAESHGDAVYRFTVPDNSVLTQDMLDSMPAKQLNKALSKIASGKGSGEVKDLVVSGGDVWGHSNQGAILGNLGKSDLGEASWELQRRRGKLAKELGFKAVEMPDEHGLSYLIVGDGAIPRPANDEAKKFWR